MARIAAHKIEALRNLQIDTVDFIKGEIVDTTVNPTVIEHEDGSVVISAEGCPEVADYYNEFGDGCPSIHASLEALATRLGLMLEWNDPGTVGVYNN